MTTPYEKLQSKNAEIETLLSEIERLFRQREEWYARRIAELSQALVDANKIIDELRKESIQAVQA